MRQSKKKKRKAQTESNEKKYKRRSSKYERINITLFLSVFFFTGLCLVFLKRPHISEIEKRELAKKPQLTPESYFDGSFADEFTVYFSDTVPFREKIVEIVSSYNKLKGISTPTFYGNVEVVADDEGVSNEETDVIVTEEVTVIETKPPAVTENTEKTDYPAESKADVSEQPAPAAVTSEPPAAPETSASAEEEEVNNIADFSNNGIVVDGVKMYGDNAGVMLFGGSKSVGTRYAELISAYKNALGEDINVYNMVVPTSVEFYLPKKFRKYSSSELNAINHIYESYTADVIPVDAYSEIAAHTDEYIYLRTDHHWSQRGAYYAYKAFAAVLGQTAPDIDKDYEVKTKEGFVGSLYNYTNDATLKNSPEIFTYYMPKSNYRTFYYDYATLAYKGEGPLFYENVSGGNCYGMFIGADAIHTKITTEQGTGRKLCVFKESYGNALVPYLVDSFDEIYVIDIRFFGRNAIEYIRENEITDVLFVNNAFAANTNSLIDGIERLYTNPYGTLDEEKIAAVMQYNQTMQTTAPAATQAAVPASSVSETAVIAQTTAPVSEETTVIPSEESSISLRK